MAASVNTAVPTTPRRWSRLKLRETIEGYLLISPWLIGFLIFTLGPMLASLYFSFTHYSIVSAPRFIGVENYLRAFGGKDRLFYVSLQRTLEFAILYVPLGVAISLGLALLLNQKLRGTAAFRTLFFIPTLTPIAAAALIWTWLLHPDVGPVNYLLSLVGVQGPRWLGSPQWAVPAIVLAALWGSVGGSRMIIFLAGLQGVPQELHDSAQIDGANALQRFWYVTLPLISPVVFFNLILTTLAAFRVFALAIIATDGGPSYATWFYMLHLYNQAFRSLQMGYASALAWIFFLIALGFTIVQFRLAARWVHYAGEKER
jgi:multiple sugar transport system permease protein